MNEVAEVGFVVYVDQDSTYRSQFAVHCEDVFSLARRVLDCDFVSVIFPQELPGYCMLIDDDARQNGWGVNAVGTYLFGHYMEGVPMFGPFLIVRYFTDERDRKTYSALSKEDAEYLVSVLDTTIVPKISKALKALLKQRNKKQFRVL